MELNINPYYDDHEAQAVKNYKQILFNPGRPLQARELTQIQSILIDQIKENMGTLYKSGSLVEGCDLSISGTTAYFSAGLIYFEGRVYRVDAQDIAMTGVGTERFGLKISETIITSNTDSSLNDPASGFSNYNQSGGDRLKQEWLIAKDDVDMIEFYETNNGVIVTAAEKPDYNKILDTLAVRTYDESGNYLVNGMKLNSEDSPTANKMFYTVDPGKAYIRGYSVNFISPQKVEVDLSQTTSTRLNEPETFLTGTSKYKMNVPYVKEMDAFTASVQVNDILMNRHLTLDYDIITGYNTVSSILVVSSAAGGGGTVYTAGNDYTLGVQSGFSTIDWTGALSEPTGGTSYYVSFIYLKDMVNPADFTLTANVADPDYTDVFLSGGDLPIHNTTMLFDYTYYLARTDLVSIDKDGNIIVTEGTPSYFTLDNVPLASEQYLPLGTIKLLPNLDYDRTKIYEYKYNRVTMRQLYKLITRVDDLEINQAELALEAEAKDTEMPTLLRGILVDNFGDFRKSNTTSPDWKSAINMIDNELTMTVSYSEIAFNNDNNTYANVTAQANDGLLDASLTLLSQSVAVEILTKTEAMNLNPYGYLAAAGTAVLTPRIDSWISEQIINIERTLEVNTTSTNAIQLPWTRWATASTTTTTNFLGTSVANSETIQDRIIPFARAATIALTGERWNVGSRIQIDFDGVRVLPTSGIVDGSNYLIVQAGGVFTGTFVVPVGTRTGAHKVTITDIDDNVLTNATFTSTGINRIITRRRTFTERNEIVTTRRIVSPRQNVDPLAQSFEFATNKTFSSIDLFFKTKGTANTRAFLQVGYMVNGTPSQDSIFLHQLIDPADINVSDDGSLATNIAFNSPFFIPTDTPFFITIGSETNSYRVFVSEMGGTDIATGKLVASNSYLTGVLFASSNNSTWTALQTKDLSLKLYEATFETTGSIITENIAGLSYASINPQIDTVIPPNTKIDMFFSENNGTSWQTILPDEFNQLNSLSTSAKIKLVLTGNGSATPVLDLNSLNIMSSKFNTDNDNYYVTKTITDVPDYNEVKMIFDMNLPPGCNINLLGSVDGGMFFPLDGSAPVTSQLSTDVYNYVYTTNIATYETLVSTNITGIPIPGELFEGAIQDFTYQDHNGTTSVLLSGATGALTSETSFTGATSGAIITKGAVDSVALLIGNTFVGKIGMTNSSALSSPVIEKLKYILKEV